MLLKLAAITVIAATSVSFAGEVEDHRLRTYLNSPEGLYAVCVSLAYANINLPADQSKLKFEHASVACERFRSVIVDASPTSIREIDRRLFRAIINSANKLSHSTP